MKKRQRERILKMQKAYRTAFDESLIEHVYKKYLSCNREYKCHLKIAKEFNVPGWMIFQLIRWGNNRRRNEAKNAGR